MTEPVRLAKRVAAQAACSRREAELYIEGGWVRVDGEVVEEPQFKVTDQTIEIDPAADLAPVEPAILLLHKPPGYDADAGENSARQLLVPTNRAASDDSGIRPLKRHFAQLTVPMPLDADASGLLIFTQDWKLARQLTDRDNRIEQEYIVEVAGNAAPDGLKLLNHGLSYNGAAVPPMKVSWQNETRLRFALKLVQPGQLRHMCAAVGLQVLAIKRIRIGRVPMAQLPPGQWRYWPTYKRF